MQQFFQTWYGKKLLQHQIPDLIKALQDIAGGLRDNARSEGDKHVGIESLLDKNASIMGDKIFFAGYLKDGTVYAVTQLVGEYYIYVNGNKQGRTYGTLVETFEAIADEIGFD